MSITLSETDLPVALNDRQAVEAAYGSDLTDVAGKLRRGLPVLIEADKDLAPWLFANLRDRLRPDGYECVYLDGRNPPEGAGAAVTGFVGIMLAQLRAAVRGAVQHERRVLVIPHLDLLTTSQGGLSSEAREVIPLLYENPQVVWLGFKDPTFPLPKVIDNLFPHRLSLLGIPRPRLRHLITQKEARKFGRSFNPWQLYKYVSGVNAVRLRKLLSTLEGEDYPADPKNITRQLRQATLTGSLEVPEISLENDIGGYVSVKKRLRQEILDVLSLKEKASDSDEIAKLEELIPRGMIFWGPPGTGKTYFAKAMAAALGAAITIVSGPELKSRWVGESEENIRMIFHKARQSAPSIIVFDELDSFATARGTYTGSGVEHSMVNQLLTEMDGFHREEMVFVVGTTNFVESLDPALLRPGRFEFHLEIPYPNAEDRKAILGIYDRKMKLQFSDEALTYAVKRTDPDLYATPQGTPFSGDHLNALCRAVARLRIRESITGPTVPTLIERSFNEYAEKKKYAPREERLMATHEAGHFVCSLHCPHHPPPERITIDSEMSWAPAYVRYKKDESRQLGCVTRNELLDHLCVLYGGIEAERLLLDDISDGAAGSDLARATEIAHIFVELYGMGEEGTGLRQFRSPRDGKRIDGISERQKQEIDRQVNQLVAQAQARAAAILRENRAIVEVLRDEVLARKTIEAKALDALILKPTTPTAGQA